jgi:hypothetical protein
MDANHTTDAAIRMVSITVNFSSYVFIIGTYCLMVDEWMDQIGLPGSASVLSRSITAVQAGDC